MVEVFRKVNPVGNMGLQYSYGVYGGRRIFNRSAGNMAVYGEPGKAVVLGTRLGSGIFSCNWINEGRQNAQI